jgi:hypothetical protein
VQALFSSSAAAPDFSFAVRARIAVAYSDADLDSDTSQRMPVVRLDRNGLIARVNDDAGVPPLWLPRPARVLFGGETLCELRLVTRTLTRLSGNNFELTMQPSRADDGLSFWLALRACRHLYPEMPGGSEFVGRVPRELEPAEVRRPRAPSSVSNRSQTKNFQRLNAVLQSECMYADMGCEVIFKLLDNNDALFFSEWLEYHFAEIAAHARAAPCPADLHDIHRHRVGAAVKVAFSFRWGSPSVERATNEVCTRISLEVKRLFGISLRHELLDVRGDKVLRNGRQHSASSTSPPQGHSFSSK